MDRNPGETVFPAEETEGIPSTASLGALRSSTHTTLHTAQNRIIVLATNDVTDHTLFLNGLTQNILILYDLFASLGEAPYLLQNPTPTSSTDQKKAFLQTYRTLTTEQMVKQGMPIALFIEIGMSVDAMTRGYLKACGARIAKLYLGNILNIDVETTQNHRSFFFNHHVVGEIDEIWTSPHYYQHIDYAAILNRTDPAKAKVAPYVWDPCFLTQYGRPQAWTAPTGGWETTDLIVMDPNISFQKYAFYTLLLANAFAHAHPEWKGKVIVVNGDRMRLSPNALNRFLPSLELWKEERIVLQGRQAIHSILKDHPSACFVTHQWNNAYNYMLLEAMYCDYPVLHNSEGWSAFGYSYRTDQWADAIDTLFHAVKDHATQLPIYRTHTANLIWKHSIHHPTIRTRWIELLQ